MFTGLVEARGEILAVQARASGLRLWVRRPAADFETSPGDSISVSGACLTVVDDPAAPGALAFDLSAETLALTWFGAARPGASVNLERALQLGERLGGHLVSGHVDGLATVAARRDSGDGGAELLIEVRPEHARFLIQKGSVTLDGVSLTVVRPQGARFVVALIPETLSRTTLDEAAPGRRLHLEVDLIGKWIERLMPSAPHALGH